MSGFPNTGSSGAISGRAIWGRIKGTDGSTLAGTGFTASRTTTGKYTITFSTNFTTIISVLVCVHPATAVGAEIGVAFNDAIAVSGFNVGTTNAGAGAFTDQDFSFLVIGT